VEEDLANNAVIPAKAGIQTNDVSPVSLAPRLRGGDGKNDFSCSMYLWVGIASCFPILAFIVPAAVANYIKGTWHLPLFSPGDEVSLSFWLAYCLCIGLLILLAGFSFFYYAVQISKDQGSFAKYPPRLPSLLPILTGEEKAPGGFRNRINFWGDMVYIGLGFLITQLMLVSLYVRSGAVGGEFAFLLVGILAYFLFALFFAGIPRRRYWGMIFLGTSVLLINFIALSLLATTLSKHKLLDDYVVAAWYLFCFTLSGVLGLYAFRKKGVAGTPG